MCETHDRSSIRLASRPGTVCCRFRRRCSGRVCRHVAGSNLSTPLRSKTRHRRRGMSNEAHSAHRNAHPETSPHQWLNAAVLLND